MIEFFLIFTLFVLSVLVFSHNHRLKNLATIFHIVSYIGLFIVLLVRDNFPIYYTENNYFMIDYFAVYSALICSVIFLLCAIYAKGYIESLISSDELNKHNLKMFYILFNLLFTAIIMAFFSNNFALFWIFAEVTTIFSAMLISLLNTKTNIDAALKYVFIASSAMLFSFIGLILLFAASKNAIGTGTLNWNELLENAALFSPHVLLVSFIFIFIGFAAKTGIAPFHSWLPHAHAKAPSLVSAVLSGALLSVGMYGIIRIFSIVHQTAISKQASFVLIFFGILSMTVAVFSMLKQKNIKKLIAFSSIENMGFLLVCVGIGTPAMIFWGLFLLLAHALTKTLLFLSAGILNRQFCSNYIDQMKNVISLCPFGFFSIVIGSVAICGMPLFALFVSKYMILFNMSQYSITLFIIILVLLFFGIISFVISLSEVATSKSEHIHLPKYIVPKSMKIPIIILIIMVFLLGIWFPEFMNELLSQIIQELRL